MTRVTRIGIDVEAAIDPAYLAALRARPDTDLRDIDTARRTYVERFVASPRRPGVCSGIHRIRASDGAAIEVGAFRPADPCAGAACLFWIPGGGYVLPNPDFDEQWCSERVEAHGCVVVAVGWRRAPEHPFPTPADDCMAALAWTVEHAADLGINTDRVVIGGMSSGGGSAAGLALLARDRGGPRIRHQLLVYPMLDDTNTTASSHRILDRRLWHREANDLGWRAYLGAAHGTDDVSPYAAPARMRDLAGLPPTTMLAAELDLFVDENIAYAQRLMAAGVAVELHVYPRVTHGFPRMAPDAGTTLQFLADVDRALARAFAPDVPDATDGSR